MLHQPVFTSLPADPVLRINETARFVSLGKSTVWRLLAQNKFPRPIKLTDKAVGWRMSSLQAWLDSRPTS